MHKRPRLVLAALALSLAGSTALNAAPNPSLLAECKLDLKTAKARVAKMKKLAVEDWSVDEASVNVTRYEASALRPLRMQATAFEHELTSEDGEQTHRLITTLDAPFEAARDAMLAANGKKECFQPFARPIPLSCMVSTGNDRTGMPGIWIEARRGKTQIICRYSIAS